jgi:hypothetical protein
MMSIQRWYITILLIALCAVGILVNCVYKTFDDNWLDNGSSYLCSDCRKLGFICMIGECSRCGDMTASAAFKYCYDCAKELDCCQHCGRSRWMDELVP